MDRDELGGNATPGPGPWDVPDFSVTIDGVPLRGDLRQQVVELRAESHLDLASTFRLRLSDPALELIDSLPFPVGAVVEVAMGYSGKLVEVLKGEVAALEPSFPESGTPSLTVTGYDRSHALRHGRRFRQFLELNDSGIVMELARLNNLSCQVDGTRLPSRASVSHLGSDWELLERLAGRNGFEVFVRDRTLHFRAPRSDPDPEPLTLTWGRELRGFSPRVTASGLVGLVRVRDYDDGRAQTVVASERMDGLGGGFARGAGRFRPEVDAKLRSAGERLARGSAATVEEADSLASSRLRSLAEGLLTGSGTCLGEPRLRAGDTVRVEGVGTRFAGTYRLRSVAHSLGERGFETRFELGPRHSTTLVERLRRGPAGGDSPGPTGGLAPLTARVTDTRDPEKRGRVRVSFPQFSEDNQGPSARVATLAAGASSGTVFPPEVGDDVLVVFEQGDIDRPLVVGGLWNHKARPPEPNDDGKANVRVIKTKAGHLIRFDDTKGEETLRVEHAKGSAVAFAANGDVTVESIGHLSLKGKSLAIEATAGPLAIKAPSGAVTVETNQTMTLSATNVDVKVDVAMDVRGR